MPPAKSRRFLPPLPYQTVEERSLQSLVTDGLCLDSMRAARTQKSCGEGVSERAVSPSSAAAMFKVRSWSSKGSAVIFYWSGIGLPASSKSKLLLQSHDVSAWARRRSLTSSGKLTDTSTAVACHQEIAFLYNLFDNQFGQSAPVFTQAAISAANVSCDPGGAVRPSPGCQAQPTR